MTEQGGDAAMDEDEIEKDTDEQFMDQPEGVPDQSRISVEKIKNLKDASIRRLANTGDIVEDTGDDPPEELRFDRNSDFAGNEANMPTQADFSRGSGFIGGKLIGEAASSEEGGPEPLSHDGFDSSYEQQQNIQAALKPTPVEEEMSAEMESSSKKQRKNEREEVKPSWEPAGPHPEMGGDLRDQGHDIGRHEQVTGLQQFGRDIGASGLPVLGDKFEAADLEHQDATSREHAEWSRVLSRLGGSSPGSAENLQLAEKFGNIQFPTTPDAVVRKLAPGAEFRIKEGIALDLRQSVLDCHLTVFRNMNDLIDCVKDALRRAESLERHHV